VTPDHIIVHVQYVVKHLSLMLRAKFDRNLLTTFKVTVESIWPTSCGHVRFRLGETLQIVGARWLFASSQTLKTYTERKS